MRKVCFSLIGLFFLLFAFSMFHIDLIFKVEPVLKGAEAKFANSQNFNSQNNNNSNNNMRGIWFSYLDWMNLINNSTVNGEVDENMFKKNVDLIYNNLNSIKINNLFLHVRAFGDAFYPSKLIYRSKFLKNLNFKKFDPLKVFINGAKANKIKIHGWMNPLRVFNDKDFDLIPKSLELKKWFDDEKLRTDHFAGTDSFGCWVLNPCNEEVLNLIVSSEQELLKNYDLDGVHIDDYFFPSDVKEKKYDYEYYRKSSPDCNIDSFRFQGTYNLVKRMRDKCHEIRPGAAFGAAILGNFNANKGLYADVEAWLKDGLVDYLIPEIYYSFKNKFMPFDRCVQEWNSLIEKHGLNLKFYVGLAAYRIMEEPQKSDEGWRESSGTILKEQQAYCKAHLKNYGGYCLFDYKSIFEKDGKRKEVCSKELDNLLNNCVD